MQESEQRAERHLCCCFCVSTCSFFLKVSIFSDEGENTLWGGFEMSFSSALALRLYCIARETRNITRARAAKAREQLTKA
jgi:hypothetical protein